MEKTCGFLDENGSFHKTIKECSDANMDLQIRRHGENLDNITQRYARRISDRLEEITADNRSASKLMERTILEMIYNQSEELKLLLLQREELIKKIEQLRERKKAPAFFRSDWWMRVILTYKE